MAEWIIAQDNIDIKQELFGVPVSILKIMKRRGVSESQFDDFLSKTPKTTYDPFKLPDLDAVCDRILKLCSENKKICIYGDYDADGVTSTALLVSLLRKFNNNICFYIPSRFDDGYGPNEKVFKRLFDDGVSVIITVDCGITSVKEISYAQSLGIECMVLDHHILREGMGPDCLIVNPHREDCDYPFKDLTGCGVAFKVAQGINRKTDMLSKADLNSYLDLVAISTVADVVPLLDENRTLVKYGLDRINKRQRLGLKALLRELSLSENVSSLDLSYSVIPNINALGRMGRADKGVELLAGNYPYREYERLAKEIANTNKERKAIQEKTFEICRAALEKEDCGEYAPVIFAPGAHEGVAGIVAGTLKEELNKPVCIVSPTEDGSLKGTGRSVTGINLHSLFEGCGDVFDRFGGHAGACGFTVKNGKLEEFRQKMQELVKLQLEADPDILVKKIYIEKELEKKEKTVEFAEQLSLLEPFGEANPVPLFCMKNARVRDVKYIGVNGQHVRFTVNTNDKVQVQCIAFWGTEKYRDILDFGTVDVAGELSINHFRGKKYLQMKVIDLKESIL